MKHEKIFIWKIRFVLRGRCASEITNVGDRYERRRGGFSMGRASWKYIIMLS